MKIGIVGMGSVGATIAYSIGMNGMASSLVLTDQMEDKAVGEGMDLRHCASFIPPVEVQAGGLDLCRGMDAVVITAGTKRRPGEVRADLIRRNLSVFQGISGPLARSNPEAIFLIVSNPVDLLTLFMIKHSGLASAQVIGTGTLLDTSRFRQQISEKLRVDPRNVHAYIIGEHGQGSVPVWSCVQIGVLPLDAYASQSGISLGDKEKVEIFGRVLGAGQDVIQRKGATCYGIAQSVLRILTAIVRDERSILTVSTDVARFGRVEDVAMSLPVLISRRGVQRALNPQLSDGEMESFRAAGAKLNSLAREVGIL